MGANRRYQTRFIPAAAETVRACIEHHVRVRSCCGACGAWRDVDLLAIRAIGGDRLSLWDRAPLCPTPGCRGRVTLLYSAGAPFRPMRTTP